MNQAITIGMVVWASITTIGVIALLWLLFYVLSVIAEGFKR